MIEIYNINKYGFKIFGNNIFNLHQNSIDALFEKDYFNIQYRNNSYENIAIVPKQDVYSSSIYSKILEKIYNRIDNNLKERTKFLNIWIQKSTKQTYKKGELPFIPHIDKDRKFKVMLYLTNVNIENGPIHFLDEPGHNYEKKRLNLPEDYRKEKKNVVKNFELSKYQPALGQFGTAIFFDTNCPHFAGEQKNNKERKILRFNFQMY